MHTVEATALPLAYSFLSTNPAFENKCDGIGFTENSWFVRGYDIFDLGPYVRLKCLWHIARTGSIRRRFPQV